MPWKNGMGRTEEILVLPAGAGIDDFDLRLSIAHVGCDGPFSRFPGVDRSILALEGGGMWLDIEGREPVCLMPGGTPFTFSGDLIVGSRNIAGPTLDLNLMTRQSRGHHVMRLERVTGAWRFSAAMATYLIPKGPVDVAGVAVSALDCLQLDPFDQIILTARDPVDVIVMDVFDAA